MPGNSRRRALQRNRSRSAPATTAARLSRAWRAFWAVFVGVATVLGLVISLQIPAVQLLLSNLWGSTSAPTAIPTAKPTEVIIYVPSPNLVSKSPSPTPDDKRYGMTCARSSIVSLRTDAHLCTTISSVSDPCFEVSDEYVACPNDGKTDNVTTWPLAGIVDYALDKDAPEKLGVDEATEQAYPWSIEVAGENGHVFTCVMDWGKFPYEARFSKVTFNCGGRLDILSSQRGFIDGSDSGVLGFSIPQSMYFVAIALDRTSPTWTVRLPGADGSNFKTAPVIRAWF